jgi:alpha-ketoglutarate-dependent taurine dioxygenase
VRRQTAGQVISRTIGSELTERLRALSQRCSSTLFSTLLAAFKLLLARYHGGLDIAVGTSVASRPLPELESLIGLFVNQLVLRTDLDGNPTFLELVERVSRVSVDALAHQEVPFDRVVAALAQQREPGLLPLFQVLFLLNNMPKQAIGATGEVRVDAQPIQSQAARFDLSLTIELEGAALRADFGYRTDIFDDSTVTALADRLMAVLERATAGPEQRINDIDIHTDAEREAKAKLMQNLQAVRSDRFKGARRQAIDVSSLQLVNESSLEGFAGYPLVYTPAMPGVDLAGWVAGERATIESKLRRHGALLFRGFGIDVVEKFESFARAVCPDLVGDYGDLPKEGRGEKVYKSTPYPEDKAILFHNESSHTHRWPLMQFFACIEVAPQGGETPIVDCRKLYRELDPALARRLAERGLLYVRNFIEGLDVSWADFFKTDDRAKVEAHLTGLGTEFKWTGENNLRIRQRAQAIARHPTTGEMVFFNQIQLHHIDCMAPAERESLRELFAEVDLPRNVYYGDGAPIEPEVINEINRLYADCAIAFPWQSGDVLMVDNMLTAHGRYPFKGPRKVIVAMGQMVNANDPNVAPALA